VKNETAEKLLKLSKEEYDKYATEFSDTRKFFWRELEFLKEHVKGGDTLLDIGCGNGRLLDMFDDINIQYTGIDFSKELIAIAKENRGDKGKFMYANALSLPFEDNSFDVVFSIAVLHHIPSRKNRVRFVSEIYRVLKPKGVCVVTSWNTLQWKFAKQHAKHFFKKIFTFSKLDFGDIIIPFGKKKRKRYVHSLTKQGIKKLFKENNFKNISIKEIKRKSGYSNFVITGKKKD
jgi:ubiquinone/menaquinone biosynthesis C-methylase UbiE